MAKLCKVCGNPIYGKARYYCAKCKRIAHLEQMHSYYCKHTSRWMYSGRYWNNQSFGKCGTGSLGEHSLKDHNQELIKVENEMINLGLRKPIK